MVHIRRYDPLGVYVMEDVKSHAYFFQLQSFELKKFFWMWIYGIIKIFQELNLKHNDIIQYMYTWWRLYQMADFSLLWDITYHLFAAAIKGCIKIFS